MDELNKLWREAKEAHQEALECLKSGLLEEAEGKTYKASTAYAQIEMRRGTFAPDKDYVRDWTNFADFYDGLLQFKKMRPWIEGLLSMD